MAKRDTKKTARFSVHKQEQSLDISPHKDTKKAKAKERQEGRKEVRKALEEECERLLNKLSKPTIEIDYEALAQAVADRYK